MWTLNQQLWPKVEYPDIINTPRPCTKEQLKAYKSLEGYKYYVDSWVSKVSVCQIPGRAQTALFSACVRHSQKLSGPPLKLRWWERFYAHIATVWQE